MESFKAFIKNHESDTPLKLRNIKKRLYKLTYRMETVYYELLSETPDMSFVLPAIEKIRSELSKLKSQQKRVFEETMVINADTDLFNDFYYEFDYLLDMLTFHIKLGVSYKSYRDRLIDLILS